MDSGSDGSDSAKGKRPAKRRARPSLAKRQQLAAEKELARLQARADAEAARQRQLDDAKAAMQALIDQESERKRARLAATRPATVTDFIRERGLPDDIPYHPRYNLVGVPHDMDMQSVECIAFGHGWPAEYGGLGAYGHLRNFIKLTWPDIQFNDWLEMALRSLCDDDHAIRVGNTRMRFVNWVGAGSAGKTFAAGLYAVAWFIYDLAMQRKSRSSVTLTSTSKGIIAQRVWPVIQKLYHEGILDGQDGQKLRWGHMIESQKMVQAEKGDSKHSICALAVESGELQGSLDRIKGRHTERMLLIVDEANSTPQAIFECIPNMLTSARELVVLVIGNAGSRLDPHGLCCEPARGWKSITIEDTQWDTRGVPKWGIGPGVCIHFDGAKSPNVLAGRTEHKHIYSFERWQQVLRMGEEYRNTLQHWSQDRGFWPPDGIATTVFSEAMVISHDGTGEFKWLSMPRPCAALDPAFGGDNCVLQFGLLGELPGGRRGLQLTGRQLVPFDPDSPNAIDYQIATYVINKCKLAGVEPQLFGLDATGTGRGVAAFLNQIWSTRIQAVEFGGAASDLPASLDDPRPSREVYSNRVTELWYSARDLLVADQLKGLYPEAIHEFCSRVYEFKAKRYRLEPKEDMKLRLGASPDWADAVSILVDVARRNGLSAQPFTRKPTPQEDALGRSLRQQLDQLAEASYGEQAAFSQYAEVDY